MGPYKLSIVVPLRNCASVIEARLDCLAHALSGLSIAVHSWILIDDASSDETVLAAGRWAAGRGEARLIRHPRTRGMESAGQTGLDR
ncbi:MAG: glycosyltransferase, partial [Planctomycetota bacterium]